MLAALSARLDSTRKSDKGFTLVELLVVVLIIGILTAIAVPVFIGQQNQAKDAAAKSDLGNAKVAVVSAFTANPQTGYTVTQADLEKFGYVKSTTAAMDITGVTSASSFCLDVASDTGTTFKIDQSTGAAEGSC